MAEASSAENIFDEFDKPNKEDWINKVITDLKGASFDSLIWHSPENINVQPFYTSEDTKKIGYIKNFQHNFANVENPAYGPRHWTNYESIDVTDGKQANKLALNALEMGADGLLFKLSNPDIIQDFDLLLDQVLCEHCHISFDSKENAMHLVQSYSEYLEKSGINPENINGFYNQDSLAAWTTGAKMPDDNYFKELANLFTKTSNFPGFKPLTISSHTLEHSGANLVQEIAFTLNMAVDYFDRLTDQGLKAERIINGTLFSLTSGSDFFMQIAKFRAFRILFHQVALSYELEGFQPGTIKIHGVSSHWNKTLADINNNMLRNTSEAMAAIIGGCDSIHITPHDSTLAPSSVSSRRIARNISNILKDEAYLDKVADPAAGSYYLENLTNELAKAAWALFKEIEKAGGFISSFKTNSIQDAIGKTRHKKFKHIASRGTVIVGVNQYPDKTESLSMPVSGNSQKNTNEGQEYDLLTPYRASEQFESLRMKTLQHAEEFLNGKRPGVFAVSLGQNSPMQKARIGFVDTFFACAGFEVRVSSSKGNFAENIEESISASEKIVVICGSNEDYKEEALNFVRKFKSGDNEKMLWLAGIPPGDPEELTRAGLHGFIHVKSDVIATMKEIQHFLGIDKGEEVKLI